MNKLAYCLGGGLLVGLLVTAPAMAGISVSVQPTSQSVSPGGTVTVNIVVSGLQGAYPNATDPPGPTGPLDPPEGSNEIIRFYDLLLGYDFNLLTATGIVFSNNLDGGIRYSPPNDFTQILGDDQADPPILPSGSVQRYALDYHPADGSWSNPLLTGVNDIQPPQFVDENGFSYDPGYKPGQYQTAVEFFEQSLLCYDSNDTCVTTGRYLKDIQTADSFTLATITFAVSPTAPTNIATVLDLMDGRSYSPTSPLFDMKGIVANTALQITLNDGNVHVPEPGTLALFLGGISLLSTRAVRRWKAAPTG